MASDSAQNLHSLAKLAFGGGTPRRAAITALIVGTILVGINHGDTAISGEPVPFHKVLLTYCVPYLVATWGAITGKMSILNSDQDP